MRSCRPWQEKTFSGKYWCWKDILGGGRGRLRNGHGVGRLPGVTIFKRLGRALRFLREKRGKSQKQVAAAAGVTPPMLSAYENERTCPEIDTLDKILKLGLEASLSDLCWALDVVNDRVPRAGHPGGRAGEDGGERGADSERQEIGAIRPLPVAKSPSLHPSLEEGYTQILSGLMEISQVVFSSVAPQREPKDGDAPPSSD